MLALGDGKFTREWLARMGNDALTISLAHVGSRSTESDRTFSYSVGTE